MNRMMLSLTAVLMLVAMVVGLVGCEKEQAPPPAAPTVAPTTPEAPPATPPATEPAPAPTTAPADGAVE